MVDQQAEHGRCPDFGGNGRREPLLTDGFVSWRGAWEGEGDVCQGGVFDFGPPGDLVADVVWVFVGENFGEVDGSWGWGEGVAGGDCEAIGFGAVGVAAFLVRICNGGDFYEIWMSLRRVDSRSIPNNPLLTILHQSNVHRTTPFSQSRIFYYNFCPSQRCRPQQFNVHGNRVRLVVFLECSPVMQSYDFRQQREQVSAMGHSSPAEVRMDSNSVLMLAEGFDERSVSESGGRQRHG